MVMYSILRFHGIFVSVLEVIRDLPEAELVD
jgi:hypothetical protein